MAKSAGRHSSCAKQKRKKDMTDCSKQQPRPVLSSLLRLLGGGALLVLSAQALAQYMWLDEKGIKHLSDRPPPPAADSDASSASASDAKPDAKPKAPTLAERNADFNKRQAEAAKKSQLAGAEAEQKAAAAANCDAARNNQRALDQGIRMSTYDKDGQRTIMDDDQRAAAAAKNKKVLADCN